MRSIILCMATSLDGFIEDSEGKFDWCLTDQDYGMSEFLGRIDTLLMGRKSYEAAAGNPFPQKQCYVFSNRLSADAPGIKVVGGDILAFVKDLKNRAGGDIWLFGGASLSRFFVENQLVDELWLAVHPLLLHSGKPFLDPMPGRTHLRLMHTRSYSSGLVSLYYRVVYEPGAGSANTQ